MLAVTLSGSIWRTARPSRRPVQAGDKKGRKRHRGQVARLKCAAAARLSYYVRFAGRHCSQFSGVLEGLAKSALQPHSAHSHKFEFSGNRLPLSCFKLSVRGLLI
jgi:hypothetical protein